MMSRLTTSAAILLFITPFATAQEAAFIPLGNLSAGDLFSTAQDITPDGTIVVGASSSGSENNQEAFIWTEATGMVGIGDLPGGNVSSMATGISANGSVVVGQSSSENGPEAFIWTAENGIVGLGYLNGSFFFSQARSVSADGSVVVGQASSENGPEAFIWTAENGMIGLGNFPDGAFFNSNAEDVSADGTVIVGQGSSANGSEAFIWTEQGGMVNLGNLGGAFVFSIANAVSSDGTAVVGQSASDKGPEAFLWTEGDGMVGLGDLGGLFFYSQAFSVSADGSVVVGEGFGQSDFEAFIWTEHQGMRSIKEILENEYDLDLTGWSLMAARSVSADGSVIVGNGINPDGNGEAWMVVLPSSTQGPENDHIADAIVIPIMNATHTGTNVNATLEDDEPEPSCTFGAWTTNFSVWWTFTAAMDANRVNINTFDSDFDTILSLHRGDDLEEVACDDDTDGLQSQIVDASLVGGETYLIRVAGYNQSGANQGDIQLTTAFHWVSGEPAAETFITSLTAPSPNPVSGTAALTLTVDREQNVTVEVFDVIGRRVQTLYNGLLIVGAEESLSLDTTNLSAGMYIIRAVGEDFLLTQRVTVIR